MRDRSEPETAPDLYDMHCHLDFIDGFDAFMSAHPAVGALSCTVTPEDYVQAAARFEPHPHIHTALGLHPWRVGIRDRRDRPDAESSPEDHDALEAFLDLLPKTRFVGEIGLDFSPRFDDAREEQIRVLSSVLDAIGPEDGKLISLHAVHAADAVLDMLAAHGTLTGNAVVFHWFSGSSRELTRARDAGCRFSVGPHMLKSRRGREYAKAVPIGRLLLETDEPPENAEGFTAARWRDSLENALSDIAELRKTERAELQERIVRTSRELLSE